MRVVDKRLPVAPLFDHFPRQVRALPWLQSSAIRSTSHSMRLAIVPPQSVRVPIPPEVPMDSLARYSQASDN
jgi:hypothetical protein